MHRFMLENRKKSNDPFRFQPFPPMSRPIAMRNLALFIFAAASIMFSSCDSSDGPTLDKTYARKRVAELCGIRPANTTLNWLDDVLAQADSDQLRGRVYAFKYRGGVAVVFQADIMSCMACSALDCDGEAIQLVPGDTDEFIFKMNSSSLIYNTSVLR
jgi:hypothetical protein